MPAPLTLFCLPYAGGSAAIFREWPRSLPAWVRPVMLHPAGRGVRHGDTPVHGWPEFVDDMVGQALTHLMVSGQGPLPFAIFGHSMGALVGLELAHALRTRLDVGPRWFGASASLAPALRERETHWLTCDDATFKTEVRRLGGMPDSLLEHDEFMALITPALRADFHLCGTYDPPARAPLACPLLAINGDDDARCVVPANDPAWASETTGPFASARVPAGHFFINSHRDALLAQVIAHLRDAVGVSEAPARALA
ncbi:Linear gramicidin dehydrogenase LgrE [Pandoraea horticolens]|uniref:Linear gramicidin dehydrogenase LgrE n=1 Tax=Pandoraea horticolens TaxID=2508298 RepID=A0A5E4WI88_9BURK|nr:alpha/beta fold hydrolase [Pandoraea horticolens]VVE23260.1 Linear gramicidin dehydrogenase LgrE [Pandoraea horticolens]